MKVIQKNKYQDIYEKEIEKFEKKVSNLLKNKKPASLYIPSSYILKSGGKRIRPFLVMISAEAVGAKFSDVYNAAMAVELLHNFTLVHDDIMDNSSTRRGKKTLHVKYDLSTAILTGDNLIPIAYKYLLKDIKNGNKQIIETFTQGIIEVCEGQSYDKYFETKREVTIDEYKLMIKKKTAALVEMCCSIGAQLGGGGVGEVNVLKSYGRNLGMAFQLQDDFLDIFADKSKFGKNLGGDLIEGKKTFLFLKALEKAKDNDRKILKRVITNKGISRNEVPVYQKLYSKLNVAESTKYEINKYTKLALRSVKKIKNSEAKELLIWLANTLLERSK